MEATRTPAEAAAEVLDLLEAMATLPYLGEPIDQRAHALQTAGHALAASAEEEVVAGAVLHDVARAPAVHQAYPGPHAEAGAAWCRPRFGARVAAIVGGHVAAKRWLVATDATYASTLSPASVLSLSHQGGPFTAEEAAAFAAGPWAGDAIAVRRWDDAAKIPGAAEADLDRVAAVLRRVAAAARPAAVR
jgi:predicted HD phosphohydrolase